MSKLPEINTILYATDLGKHMRPVFRHALGLAETHGARIIMLHVAEPLSATGQAIVEAYLPAAEVERIHDSGMHEILETMRDRINQFCEEETGVTPEDFAFVSDVVVTHGRPGSEIPRQAKARGADLIIMGSCSHGLLGRAILGSSAKRVIQASEVPVLVIPNCQKSS